MTEELDPETWRQRLLDLREELQAIEREGGSSTGTVELDQQRMGRLSRMDALQGQQMAQASARRRQEMLTRIEGALRRIEAGDFGDCFVCGEAIGENRLSVDPTVTRCIDCVNA
ncbi:TraR/DksA C4-type zinc finger protein [Halospina sp. K52047b]|jgi:DnaK suppressor protein|uniref:TraR/DksA family transcriptional regulator n=1 Tax=Halospina sp. K52047b TaxID=2614160 RepID=UPI00124AB412|nr:TraR/DksA C4-type zinc finger protein [Halospina sp. K52047b]KAA8983394.1 TraR/DksA family transcriptional regulator [Halospina sp. K52047b]